MKKIVFLLALLPVLSFAQHTNEEIYNSKKNNIKMNLSGLAFNNYSFTYERQVAKKISVSLGYNFIPQGDLPYQQQITDAINDDPNIKFDPFQFGGYALTPEIRFYFKEGMRGFYVAPYAKYSSFDVIFPGSYTIPDPSSPSNKLTYKGTFSGNMHALSAGLLLGIQQRVGKNITIDFWLIGVNYSGTTNHLDGVITPGLETDAEKKAVQARFNQIDGGPFKIVATVTGTPAPNSPSTTASLDITNWYGVKALGINIGFKF
jgi:hypothetical protein